VILAIIAIDTTDTRSFILPDDGSRGVVSLFRLGPTLASA
jgi:hypothetical protein